MWAVQHSRRLAFNRTVDHPRRIRIVGPKGRWGRGFGLAFALFFAASLLTADNLAVRDAVHTWVFLGLFYLLSALALLFPLAAAWHLALAILQATRLELTLTGTASRFTRRFLRKAGKRLAIALGVGAAVVAATAVPLAVVLHNAPRPMFLRYTLWVGLLGLPLSVLCGLAATGGWWLARRSRGRRWWLDLPAVESFAAVARTVVFLAVAAACFFALLYQPHSSRLLVLAMFLPVVWLPFEQWREPRRLRYTVPAAFAVVAAALPLVTTSVEADVLFWLGVVALTARAAWRWSRGRLWVFRPADVPGDAFLMMLATAVLCVAGHVYQGNFPPDDFALAHAVFDPGHDGAATHKLYDVKPSVDGPYAFFSDSRPANRVGRIDLTTAKVTLSPPLPDGLEQIVAGRDRIYGGYWDGGIISLSPETLRREGDCRLDPALIDLAPTFLPGYLAVLHEFVPQLALVATGTCAVSRVSLPTPAPYQTLCNPKDRACYVSGWMHSSLLAAVALSDDGAAIGVRGLRLGPFATGMALDDVGGRLFVTRPLAGAVDVVDLSALRRMKRCRTAPMVRAVAFAPTLNVLIAPEYFSGKVHLIDATSGKHVGGFRLGSQIREVVWDAKSEALLALDRERLYRFSIADLAGRIRR